MSNKPVESNEPEEGRFDSLNCIDIVLEGPGNTTPRQLTSEEIAMMEEFERRRRIPLRVRLVPAPETPSVEGEGSAS